MRTKREIVLLVLLSIVAAVAAIATLACSAEPLCWAFVLVGVWASERSSVWSERRKRTAAENFLIEMACGSEISITVVGDEYRFRIEK